jgi:hypothetical protein
LEYPFLVVIQDYNNKNNHNKIQKEYEEFISKRNIKNIISKEFHYFYIKKKILL